MSENTRKALKRGLNSVLMDRRTVTLKRQGTWGRESVVLWVGRNLPDVLHDIKVSSFTSTDKRPKYPWSSKLKSSWRASRLMVTRGLYVQGLSPTRTIIQYQVKYRSQGKPTFNFFMQVLKINFF